MLFILLFKYLYSEIGNIVNGERDWSGRQVFRGREFEKIKFD